MASVLITKEGGIKMLHDDVAELESFGKVDVTRASHVEFDNDTQKWFVQSAKTLEVLKFFDSRTEALDWERSYYSPKGEGWKELEG